MKKLVLLVFVIFCSCHSNKKEENNSKLQLNAQQILPLQPYFAAIKVNDVKLEEPVFGDWLFSHKEKG